MSDTTKTRRRGFHKRDRFGQLKHPGTAYRSFIAARNDGRFQENYSWADYNEAWRKRNRKNKIAKLSRRKNRG